MPNCALLTVCIYPVHFRGRRRISGTQHMSPTQHLPRDRQRKVAMHLLRSGSLSLAEIGQQLGMSRQSIRYWAKKHARFDYRRRREAFIARELRWAIQETDGD